MPQNEQKVKNYHYFCNIKLKNMEDVNRIKLVLVKKNVLTNGYQNNLELIPLQLASGVQILLSQTLHVLSRLQIC